MNKTAVATPERKPDKPCHNCGGRKYWGKGGYWVCDRCHPCPDKNAKGIEFIEVEGKTKI